jgi:hypothetical protein
MILIYAVISMTAMLFGLATGRAATNKFIKQNRKNEYQDKVMNLFMKLIDEDIRSNNVEALEYTAEWLKLLQMHAEWHREWCKEKIRIEEVKHDSKI